MQRSLFVKSIFILILVILLIVPLAMIRGTIAERQQSRDQAVAEMAQGEVAEQQVMGPYLRVVYHQRVQTKSVETGTGKEQVAYSTQTGSVYFLPEKLAVKGLVTEDLSHQLGIYKARFYDASHALSGDFKVPAYYGFTPAEAATMTFDAPTLVLGIQDMRGMGENPSVRLRGQALAIEAGTFASEKTGTALPSVLSSGVHAVTAIQAEDKEQRIPFDIQFALRGMSQWALVPLGETTQLSLSNTNGAVPYFAIGQGLPTEKRVHAGGFTAAWRMTNLSSNTHEAFNRCYRAAECDDLRGKMIGVRLVEPVDTYLQAERSLKYGFVFIVLTFVAFFLFEILKRLAIHPIQYLLVGVGLAMFYLLLLSLAEHIGFAWAYSIAATACIGLLSFYLCFVLRSVWRGLGFGMMLVVLYGALYVLLQSSDYALVLGSGLMFLLLAVIMFITRKVDWYQLSGKGEPESQEVA